MAAKTLFGELAKIEAKQQVLDTKLDAVLQNTAALVPFINLVLANEAKIIDLLQPPTLPTLVLTLGPPQPQ
jgi:hypothetical protein